LSLRTVFVVPVIGLELAKPSLKNTQRLNHSFSWQCAIGELLRFRAIQRDFVKTNLNSEEESERFVPASALDAPIRHLKRQALLPAAHQNRRSREGKIGRTP